MFNIAMALIVGTNSFLAADAFLRYSTDDNWQHPVAVVIFSSLAVWALIRATKEE